MNSELEARVKTLSVGGKLPCATAFQIARELKVSQKEVGDMANKLKIRLSQCQLGCFP